MLGPAGSQAQENVGSPAAPSALAADGLPAVATLPLAAAISLDGRLLPGEWDAVVPATAFTQTEPLDGAPATERTEVFVMYDEDAIYIGARLWDSSGRVSSRLGRRDSFMSDSDWFYVMLDSHHDHVSAYQFSVNPAGVKRDEKHAGGRPDDSWDAIWEVATSVDSAGWSVEIRIPFSQLRFSPAAQQLWGIQFGRRISRLQEVTTFSHTPKSQPGGIARYGHLTGLANLRQGKRLEVLPYVLSRAEYTRVKAGNPFRDGSDYFTGAGLDLRYSITPSLTLDATLNPDFGQVEVDPAVVNLSANETSLQEKRPFFMEGSNLFAFGGAERGLFYSRRVGRSPQGSLPSGISHADRPDAATIIGAAKLTGRTAGGLSIGLLAAAADQEEAEWLAADGTTGSTVVEPRTAYVVGRARQELRAGQTGVGAMATLVQRSLSDEALERALRATAVTGGIDFTHFFRNRVWSVEGFAVLSHVRGSVPAMLRTQLSSSRYFNRPDADYLEVDSQATSLTGYAARLEVGRRAGLHWRGEAAVAMNSPALEINDAGFQTTVDRITSSLNITYLENQPGTVFRTWRVSLSGNADRNFGGDLINGRGSLNFNWGLLNYWGGMFSVTRSVDTWDDRLTRGGPVARDPGGFNISGNVNSDGRRRISGRLSANRSSGNSGSWHQGLSAGMTLRPAANWTISAGPRLDRSRSVAQYLTAVTDPLMAATFGRRYLFAGIHQTTFSVETRLDVNFTPDLSLELFAQPFVSTGDYGAVTQLAAARTATYQQFGRDIGTATYDAEKRLHTVDPDGTGPAAPISLSDRDFTTRSLRGNAVLRWEWRPGSTLFVVWQQRRAGSNQSGEFDFGPNVRGIFDAPPENFLVLKLNYWLNL